MFRYLILVLAAGGCAAVEIYPAPTGENLSDEYDLTVGGQKVPVYMCRVPAIPFNGIWLGQQRPPDQTELAAFENLRFNGRVIRRLEDSNVEVRPFVQDVRFQAP